MVPQILSGSLGLTIGQESGKVWDNVLSPNEILILLPINQATSECKQCRRE